MHLLSSDFKIITQDLKDKIIENYISSIAVINTKSLILSFSMHRNEKLFICLEHQLPFVTLLDIDESISTMMSLLNDTLRKEIKDAKIKDIEQVNNDKIIKLTLQKSNDLFIKETKYLYIECLSHNPNLILTDQNNLIIFATHYKDLSSPRPILKNLKYSNPINNLEIKESDINLEDLKGYAQEQYFLAKEKRLKEKYLPLMNFIKSRIKILKRKIDKLENENAAINSSNDLSQIANDMLTLASDKNELFSYVKNNNLDYDMSLSPYENVNKYFKKVKKNKATKLQNLEEIKKAKEEIKMLETSLSNSVYMSEEELLVLAHKLMPFKFNMSINKLEKLDIPHIYYKGIKISYGKNAKQNDELTFKKANKEDLFLHISLYHGSHVIIHNKDISDDLLLLASEIALITSKKVSGEVRYAKVKTIKKGPAPGAVIFTNYKSISINKIREETYNLITNK